MCIRDRDNVIYVGRKFFMRYVAALLMKFNYFKLNKVIVKARGKAISRAVHVVVTFINSFNSNVRCSNIKIGSVNIDAEGRRLRLSVMEIELVKEK